MNINSKKFYFNNVCLDYVFCDNSGETLYIFFNGAQDRLKPYPNFNRITWKNDFPGPCLYICDPLLAKDENLTIGWYMGGEGFDVEKAVDELIESIKCTNGIKNIVSWGSSAGGYASLRLAGRISGVKSVAINPQTNIFKYYKGHVQKFLKVAFKDNLISNEEDYDFNVMRRPHKESKYIIIQNILDDFHYKNHYLPMLDYVKRNDIIDQFKTKTYKNPSGHGPEKREMVPEILEFLD